MSLDRAMFNTGERFTQLPADLVRMFGSANTALVMARIEFRCRMSGFPDQIVDEVDGETWWRVSQAFMGAEIGLSRRQVETAIKYLLDHDHLESTEHNIGNNYVHTRSYRPRWKSTAITGDEDEEEDDDGYEANEDPTIFSGRSHGSVGADPTDDGSPIPPIGDVIPYTKKSGRSLKTTRRQERRRGQDPTETRPAKGQGNPTTSTQSFADQRQEAMESGDTGWGLALRLEAGMYHQWMRPEVNVNALASALDGAYEVLDFPWELQAAMVDLFLADPKAYMRSKEATPWREFIAHGLTIAEAARVLLAETARGRRVLAKEQYWKDGRTREADERKARAREDAYQSRLDNDPAFAAAEAEDAKIRNDELVAQLAAEVEEAEQAEARARQQADRERQREEALAEKRAREAAEAEQVRTREAAEAERRSQEREARRLKRVEAEITASENESAQRMKKRAEDTAKREASVAWRK